MRITALVSTLALSVCLTSTAFAASGMAGDTHGTMIATPMIHQGSYTVTLNKTELVRLPSTASAVIVGNPNIADVSVHSSDTIFIIGRGYGDTNIIILDASGQTVMNANVQVTGASSQNNIRVYNGSSQMRSTYSCAPYCQPSPILGDDVEFIGANSPQDDQINNAFAGGSSAPSGQTLGVAAEFSEGLEAATEEPDVSDITSN